jgi:hypothetical protein
LRIAKLGGYREHGIDRDAHGQGVQIAIVDRAALRGDLDDALLLLRGVLQILAMLEQLQVSQAHEDGHHPHACAYRDDYQALGYRVLSRARGRCAFILREVRTVLGHFEFSSANALPAGSLEQLQILD